MSRQHYSSLDIALLTDPTGWCPWTTDNPSPRQPQQSNGALQTAPQQGQPSMLPQQAANQCNGDSTAGTSLKPSYSQGRGGSIGSPITSSNRNGSTAQALPSQRSKASVAARSTTYATDAQSTTEGKASTASSSAALHKQHSRTGSPCAADMQQNSRASRPISRAGINSAAVGTQNSKKGVIATPRTIMPLPTPPISPNESITHQKPTSAVADEEMLLQRPASQDSSPRYFAPQFHPKTMPVKRHGKTTSRQASAGITVAKPSSAAISANNTSNSSKGKNVAKRNEAAAGGPCSNLLQTQATAAAAAAAAAATTAAATVAGSLTLNHAWEQRVTAGGAAAASSAVSFCAGTADSRYRPAVRPAAVAPTSAAADSCTGQFPELAVRRALRTTASMSDAPAADIICEARAQQAAVSAALGRSAETAANSLAAALRTITVPSADSARESNFCCHQELNLCRLDRICGAWGEGGKQSSTFTAAAVAGAAARMVQSSDTAAAVARMMRFTAAAEARVVERDRAYNRQKQQQQKQQQQQQQHQQQQQLVLVSEQTVQQELRHLLLGRLYPQMNSSLSEQSVDKQKQESVQIDGPKVPTQCRILKSSSLRVDASSSGWSGTASLTSELQDQSANNSGEHHHLDSQKQQLNTPQQQQQGLAALGHKSGLKPAGTALPDLMTNSAVLPKMRQDPASGTAVTVVAAAALPQGSLQGVHTSELEELMGTSHDILAQHVKRSSSGTGRQSAAADGLAGQPAVAAAAATEAKDGGGSAAVVKLPSLSRNHPACGVPAIAAGAAANARFMSSSSSSGSSSSSSLVRTGSHNTECTESDSVEAGSRHGSLAARGHPGSSSLKSFKASSCYPSLSGRQVVQGSDHLDTSCTIISSQADEVIVGSGRHLASEADSTREPMPQNNLLNQHGQHAEQQQQHFTALCQQPANTAGLPFTLMTSLCQIYTAAAALQPTSALLEQSNNQLQQLEAEAALLGPVKDDLQAALQVSSNTGLVVGRGSATRYGHRAGDVKSGKGERCLVMKAVVANSCRTQLPRC